MKVEQRESRLSDNIKVTSQTQQPHVAALTKLEIEPFDGPFGFWFYAFLNLIIHENPTLFKNQKTPPTYAVSNLTSFR